LRITNLRPSFPVIWYVGFDWPKPNCNSCLAWRHLWRGEICRRTNLLDIYRNLYLWHGLGDEALQRRHVNGLSHATCHRENLQLKSMILRRQRSRGVLICRFCCNRTNAGVYSQRTYPDAEAHWVGQTFPRISLEGSPQSTSLWPCQLSCLRQKYMTYYRSPSNCKYSFALCYRASPVIPTTACGYVIRGYTTTQVS
jgi:hypothetical protein